jgi:hypothetical protein
MIKPTVGRIVWYHGYGQDDPTHTLYNTQPLAAIITHVHSDVLVNLCVFNANGIPLSRPSIRLVQDDATEDEALPNCQWMPYQKLQTEKVQQLAALTNNGQ